MNTLPEDHDYICDNCRRAILAILSNTTHVSKKDEIEIDDKKRVCLKKDGAECERY